MLARLTPFAAFALLAACNAPESRRAEAPAAPAAPARPMAGGLTRQAIESAAFTPPAPAQTAPQTTPGQTTPGQTPPAGQTAPEGGADGATPATPAPPLPNAALIRAQIILDRSPYSPGAINGVDGDSMHHAIAAFEKANGLAVDGELDAEVFARLTASDSRPVLADYTISPQDLAGPFIGAVPEGTEAQSKLQTLGFANIKEALAEKFHMTEALLDALNPGVDLMRAGQTIVVPAIGSAPLAPVARILVDKAAGTVSAFDAGDQLLAVFPATIGSSDRPAPSGDLKVVGVANEPDYTWDPTRLTYGKGKEKMVVAAGPNNPVGTVWIDLSRDTYGIHGTPDPELIGKTASHGCVRLTNWDAELLAAAVKPGVDVKFI